MRDAILTGDKTHSKGKHLSWTSGYVFVVICVKL